VAEYSGCVEGQAVVLTPSTAPPRATATVDLISRVQRPYLFRVIVTGEFPHNFIRRYTIAAPDEDAAAMKGLQLFVKAFQPAVIRDQAADLAPRAKLQ